MPAQPAIEEIALAAGPPPRAGELAETLDFVTGKRPGVAEVFGEEQLIALQGAVPIVAAVRARSVDGELVGYGQAIETHERVVGELLAAAAPASRQALLSGLASALGHELDPGSRGRLELWVRRAGDPEDRALEAAGFAPARRLCQLRRALPLEPSAPPRSPVTFRSFEVGRDEPAFLAVNARAFADLPDQGSWTFEALAARERQPWFDPAGFLLHDEGGALVAFCWTKLHPSPSGPTGEIYVIGVDPGTQRRGLGSAMLQAGCGHLSSVGATSVMLYVDASNEAALLLYRRYGFYLDHEDRCYTMRPGT